MIKDHCFTEEWLELFKQQPNHKKIDKSILEKMIYALHLLERLSANGLEFVFKGGTSLVLLLKEDNRFSIDIDIICKINREKLELTLQQVVETSKFKTFELDAHRSYKTGVPKAHYVFLFDSNSKYSGRILLDILIEDSLYPQIEELPIQAKWIEVTNKTMVKIPSIDAITGDKLTAFAPNTIGIPYFKGNQLFAMEICKQLFDLSRLFESITNVEIVANSFYRFAKQEIEYRGIHHITSQNVLQDTINTCLIIAKRENTKGDEKDKFNHLQKGIKAFGTGFLMSGNFRIDDAVLAAARIAYLAAKILANDLSPIQRYDGQDIKELSIEGSEWNFLNSLKKQPDKSGFFYWYQAVELMRGM